MALITYTDKANLNSLSSVNAENKVSDADMNEIKNVVNTNWNAVKDYINVRTEKINFDITASSGTSTLGAGATTVDLTPLNATKIFGITFIVQFNYLVCGTTTDITTNPSSLTIYGYKLNGKSTTALTSSVIITYM